MRALRLWWLRFLLSHYGAASASQFDNPSKAEYFERLAAEVRSRINSLS